MSGTSKPRRTASLAKSLDKQLNLYTLAARANCRLTYAAAAGAVGASVLSLASIAEAKIIYTPVHVEIGINSWFLLDFNYQLKGTDDDFRLVRTARAWSHDNSASSLEVRSYFPGPNAVAATSRGLASALRPGERMGPHKHVVADGVMALMLANGTNYRTSWQGQWGNGGKGLKNGYLGLKFTLNGKVHYGWARVSLTVKNNRFNTVTLTGYAFETIANKPIIIGKARGPDVIVKPATLGALAAGANARSTWRTRRAAPDEP